MKETWMEVELQWIWLRVWLNVIYFKENGWRMNHIHYTLKDHVLTFIKLLIVFSMEGLINLIRNSDGSLMNATSQGENSVSLYWKFTCLFFTFLIHWFAWNCRCICRLDWMGVICWRDWEIKDLLSSVIHLIETCGSLLFVCWGTLLKIKIMWLRYREGGNSRLKVFILSCLR